jgi:uncharacterized LabA/DUF88 family protein
MRKFLRKVFNRKSDHELMNEKITALEYQVKGLRFSFGEFQGGLNQKLKNQSDILTDLIEVIVQEKLDQNKKTEEQK